MTHKSDDEDSILVLGVAYGLLVGVLAVLGCLIFAIAVMADDDVRHMCDEPASGEGVSCASEFQVVVPFALDHPLPARVLYVFDVSSSMTSDQLVQAYEFVQADREKLPFDGAYISVAKFGAYASGSSDFVYHLSDDADQKLRWGVASNLSIHKDTQFRTGIQTAVSCAGDEGTVICLISDGGAADKAAAMQMLLEENRSYHFWMFVHLGEAESYPSNYMREMAESVAGCFVQGPPNPETAASRIRRGQQRATQRWGTYWDD